MFGKSQPIGFHSGHYVCQHRDSRHRGNPQVFTYFVSKTRRIGLYHRLNAWIFLMRDQAIARLPPAIISKILSFIFDRSLPDENDAQIIQKALVEGTFTLSNHFY